MKKIYERVCKWNEARYDREYNEELAYQLLREEYQEWLQADNNVNDIKELADIVFVCMGIIWKCNIPGSDIANYAGLAQDKLSDLMSCKLLPPAYYCGAFIDALAFVQEADPTYLAQLILHLALHQLTVSGLSQEEIRQIMSVVCDSNESKPVERVPSNVKANATKGERFRPAEPDISLIIGEAQCELIH